MRRPRLTRRRLLSTGLGVLVVSTGTEVLRAGFEELPTDVPGTGGPSGESEGGERVDAASGAGCRRPLAPLSSPGERNPIPYDLAVHNNSGSPATLTVRVRDPATGAVHLERTVSLDSGPASPGPERTSEGHPRDGGRAALVRGLPVASTRPARYLVEVACPDGPTASAPLRVTPAGVTGEEAVVASLGPAGVLDVTTIMG